MVGYLRILPGAKVSQIPGVLAKEAHQAPLKGPQADCAVAGSQQEQVWGWGALLGLRQACCWGAAHAADAAWMGPPT